MERLPRAAKMLKDIPKNNRSKYYEKVVAAVAGLHERNFVHGDLRENNIFVDDTNGGVWILDFDWCGLEDVGHYPFAMSSSIAWPEGAGNRKVLKKGHDDYWIQMHFESSSSAKRARLE